MMSWYRNKIVLVTGGCGFIGSHIARRLVALGAQVRVLDSFHPKCGANRANIADISEQITLYEADMTTAEELPEILAGVDVIFNMVGQVSHIDSMEFPLDDLTVNSAAQLTLLEACRVHCPDVRIVYASTRQVYGVPDFLPVDESHPVRPVDVNGIHKYAGERYHMLYHRVYGLRSTALRLTNVYGPGQLICHNRQGFTGIFIREAILGRPLSLYGGGDQLRDFVFVDDVAEAFLLAAQSEDVWGEVFNVGYPKSYSLLDFVKALQNYCDFEYKTVPFPPEKKPIDIGDYYSNDSAFRERLGWSAKVDLAEGLEKTVAYYRKHWASYYADAPIKEAS